MLQRKVTGLMSVVFLLMQMSQPFAQTLTANQFLKLAQLDAASPVEGIDLDPPQVDHIPVSSGVAGSVQSISVKASDAQGVASVTLLYRSAVNAEYKRVLMQPVVGTDNYTVAIDSSSAQRFIEYYFLVIDTGGNKVLNGFPYEPFTRALTEPTLALENVSDQDLPASSSTQTETTVETPPLESADEPRQSNSNTLLWVALGVLAVGVLASASGGGGGGSSADSGETVPVILNVPVP